MRARACAVLSSDNRASLAQEQTIIVWDEPRHTEHFIRRLEFNTGDEGRRRAGGGPRSSPGSGVGFLVPTPSVPTLAEVSGQAFERVQNWMRPRVINKQVNNYRYTWLARRDRPDFATASVGGAAPDGVRVLSQQNIGAMQASVLRGGATDVVRWLKRNGYPSRPSFAAWLEPYARRNWVITAFKFVPTREARSMDTTTVRLSFQTKTPFYPYREPSHQGEREPIRQLAIYFFAPQRIEARAGEQAWQTKPEWSQDVRAMPDMSALFTDLKLDRGAFAMAKQSPIWMTAWVDSLASRPDQDLQFRPSAQRAAIEAPPIVNQEERDVYVPLDLAAIGLLGVGGLTLSKRRAAKAQKPG